jgi:hypothetical protein
MLGFITMKEGYESALELAKKFDDIKFIGAFTSNKEVKLPMGGIAAKGEIVFEGEDIGKSDFWSYIFYDTVTKTGIEIVSVKVIPMGGAIMSVEAGIFIKDFLHKIETSGRLDINKTSNSDLFIKDVIDNKNLEIPENLTDCLGDNPTPSQYPLTITIGITNILPEYSNISGNTWYYWLDCSYFHETCHSPYNNIKVECSDYENIIENDLLEISIIPNPATDEIIIKTDENIDKIDVFSIDGELIDSFTSNSINVSNYAAEMYFIKFYVNNRVIVKTFIKE